VATPEGYKYWITFVDDSSRFWGVYPLKFKSEAFEAFKVYRAYAENALPGLHIVEFQDDEGGEYIGKAFIQFCLEHGIQRRHTETDEPYQNGVAERTNRTIIEGAETLLAESKLPPSFWWRAVATFVHVRNRCPTHPLPNTTPFSEWTGQKPNLSHLRVFGCLAYILVKKKKRKALQSHAIKCIFVGYAPGKKAWTFYNPQTQKFIESSHATFDERVFPGNTKTLVNPFGDLSTPTSAPPPITTSAPEHILDTSDLHRQGGVLDSDSTATDNPLSPQLPAPDNPLSLQLPAIDTPFGSPLSSIPSLPTSSPSSSRSPSPAPARSPICAPLVEGCQVRQSTLIGSTRETGSSYLCCTEVGT
jgi:hypothetical protein